MELEKIISISGKPGLFKIASQSKTGFIVEELTTSKKMAVSAQHQVSLLENIAIYTTSEEVPLKEVFAKIGAHTSFSEAIHHKESGAKLREYMEQVVPDYDKERVYDSDLKKLFMWYNLLLNTGIIQPEEKPKAAKKSKKKAEAQEE